MSERPCGASFFCMESCATVKAGITISTVLITCYEGMMSKSIIATEKAHAGHVSTGKGK